MTNNAQVPLALCVVVALCAPHVYALTNYPCVQEDAKIQVPDGVGLSSVPPPNTANAESLLYFGRPILTMTGRDADTPSELWHAVNDFLVLKQIHRATVVVGYNTAPTPGGAWYWRATSTSVNDGDAVVASALIHSGNYVTKKRDRATAGVTLQTPFAQPHAVSETAQFYIERLGYRRNFEVVGDDTVNYHSGRDYRMTFAYSIMAGGHSHGIGALPHGSPRYYSTPFTVVCQVPARQLTISVPDEVDFGIISDFKKPVTQRVQVAVTSGGGALPGTLKFTSTSENSNHRATLGGGEIVIRDTAAQKEFLLNQEYPVPSLTADYDLILDPSAAQPGTATTNLTLTLVVN